MTGDEDFWSNLFGGEDAEIVNQEITLDTIRKAARIVYLGTSHRRSDKQEYRTLINSMASDRSLVEKIVTHIAEQFELEVLEISNHDIFLQPTSSSIFKTSSKSINLPSNIIDKRFASLIFSIIAALCFPTEETIVDPLLNGLPITIDEINEKIEKFAHNIEENLQGYETSPPEEKDELTLIYQDFLSYKYKDPNKTSLLSRENMIKRILDYFIENRYLGKDHDRYIPTKYFKVQMRSLTQNPLFLQMFQLTEDKDASN